MIPKIITVGMAATVFGFFPSSTNGENPPGENLTELASFRLEKQDAGLVMTSSDMTLKNQREGEGLPFSFVLPDIYCNRNDLTYILKCKVQPAWNVDSSNQRGAIFAVGANISGRFPNSVSLAFLTGRQLVARISSADKNEVSEISSLTNPVKGNVHDVELRIDDSKIELFFDKRRLGAASVGNGFSWVKNRPFYIGGEWGGVSVFNGTIDECSLTIFQHPVENTLASQADQQELMKNPYNRTIIGAAKGILLSGNDYFENRIATEEDNWLYRLMANNLMLMSYVYTLPGSGYYKSPEVLDFLTRGVAFMANAYEYNDWIKKKNGDPNINWFILLPLAETLQHVGNDLPADVKNTALERIRSALYRHYQEYGNKDTDIYPNIDAFYMLTMLHGSQLLNEPLFGAEYERVLNNLAACQYPDGGWPYYKTTNESNWYHEMVVGCLARVYSLNQSPAALQMLEKSIPYYKLSVGPSGVAEYATDPFWKHNWAEFPARGPSIVAGVTGDANNNWIAERATSCGGTVVDYFAALFWKEMKSEPMQSNCVVLDRNTNGPRGFFPDWTWVASASYGCDTLVGCFSKEPGSDNLKGLLAVKAEIDNPGNPLGMPPSGNKGVTVINENTADFSSDYKMTGLRSVWGKPLHPFDWNCRQQWTLDAKSMTGEIVITSGADQQSPPPRVRFLFGKDGAIEKVSQDHFEYPPYSLLVDKSDFPETKIQTVPVSPLFSNKLNGRELVFSIPARNEYKKGEAFTIKVRLKKN